MISSEGECRTASRHCGYTWNQFLRLPGNPEYANGQDTKAMVIVQYRVDTILEQMKNDG